MVVVVLVVVVVVVCVATHNQQRHSDIGVASRSRPSAILMARQPGPAACRGGDMLPAPSPIHIFVRRDATNEGMSRHTGRHASFTRNLLI